MTFAPSESIGQHIPPNIILSEDWDQARLTLIDHLIKVSEAINVREIATYQDANISGGDNISETITGQSWFVSGDANRFRYGNRTVINFGALPNNTTKTAAHGLNITANTVFTRIYGTASIPGTTFIPLPYTNTAGNPIEIWVDAANVNVRTTADYSAYTQCYVVLEWVENLL